MASIVDASQALCDRAARVLVGWNSFWHEPAPIPLDAFCVRPDARFADFEQSPATQWSLRLGLYVRAVDLDAARLKMGALIDRDGELLRALTDADEDAPPDCLKSVRPVDARGWDQRVQRQRLIEVRYLYADLGVVCHTN